MPQPKIFRRLDVTLYFVYVRGAPEHDEVSSPRHLCADFKTYKDILLALPGHSKITRLIHVDIELDCRAKEAV